MEKREVATGMVAGLVGIVCAACGSGDAASSSGEWVSDVQGNRGAPEVSEEAASEGVESDASADTPIGTRRDSIIPPMAGPEGADFLNPNFVLFNPCEEIPPEVLEAVGIPEMDTIEMGELTNCTTIKGEFLSEQGMSSISFRVSSGPPDPRLRELESIEGYESVVPGLSVAKYLDPTRGGCTTFAVTERGFWQVQYETNDYVGAEPDDCKLALELHESIYNEVDRRGI